MQMGAVTHPAVGLVAVVMARRRYIVVPPDVSDSWEGVRIRMSQVLALQQLLSRIVQPGEKDAHAPAIQAHLSTSAGNGGNGLRHDLPVS